MKVHCSIALMDLDLFKICLNVAVGFLHIHWLEVLISLEIKIEPVTCMSALLARSGYFSFSILHTHLLVIADLLLSFSGFFAKVLPLNWWLILQIY